MKEIFCIINQKGGVGKSTTAHAIGAGLELAGFKVLFIDLDPQGNLSYIMRAAEPETARTALDVLTGKAAAADAIRHTDSGDIIPSAPEMAAADKQITETGKEYRLKEALEKVAPLYDYIVIDTPPALGILTINALTACTSAIIPAQADIFSLQGIKALSGTLSAVKRYCNPALSIKGILLTRYNSRAILSRDLTAAAEQTAAALDTVVFNAKIRECIAIREAQALCQSIYQYAEHSNAANDYRELINEII